MGSGILYGGRNFSSLQLISPLFCSELRLTQLDQENYLVKIESQTPQDRLGQ